MKQIVQSIHHAIAQNMFNDTQALAEGLGLVEKWRSPESNNDYEWISFDWIRPVISANALLENDQLTRVEFIVTREGMGDISSSMLEWGSDLREVFGEPFFSGDWKNDEFPNDEEAVYLAAWKAPASKDVLLLHRKEDSETPAEIVVVVRQQG